MTAPTHVAGGISTMALVSLLVPAYHINLSLIIIGAIFSMLPDIDNPKAFIGRLFFFFSGPIDRKWGHRTITHSFVAVFIVGLVTYALGFLYTHSFDAFIPVTTTVMLSYFSHLFFDAMTKQGILAYYPSRLWAVFPVRQSWRIRTGSRIELLYFSIFIITALIFLPMGQTGMVHSFNKLFLNGGIESRLEEFEVQKQKASLGLSINDIDSLLRVGSIDAKQAEELKSKLKDIEIQEKQFRGDQGLNE